MCSTLVLVGYEHNQLAGARERARVLALTVADYSAAALVFEDKEGATELLSKLKGNASVPCAWLLDPENRVLQDYAEEVRRKREAGEPTVPFPLDRELAANPFLRADEAAMRARWGGSTPPETFAALRAAKDAF